MMRIQNLHRLVTSELRSGRLIGQQRSANLAKASRCFSNNVTNVESFDSTGDAQKDPPIDPIMLNRQFFTDESNPTKHKNKHLGMFYRIPPETQNTLFAVYGWSPRHKLIFETFGEVALMIRRYSMNVINDVREGKLLSSDSDKLNRIIYHGVTGSGKSTTLNHLIHFGHCSNFVVVHLNEILNLTRLPFEYKPSEFKKQEGRVDTPMNGTMLLQHFKAQNANLIKDLKLSKTCQWSLKEQTEQGEPLINVINHGINRHDHSSDCYAVLIRELKLAANQGLIKLMIAIEDLNFIYWPTDLRRPDFTYYTTMDVTITRALRKLISSDFKNGLLVATTESYNHPRWDPDEQNLPSDPYGLLLKEGVDELNDFETIEVERYEDFEFYNCLAYYNDRLFITHPRALTKKGLQQLRFITTKIPKDVFEQMKWL